MPRPTGRSRENERRKIALFCNVRPESVIPALDASTIYEVPLSLSPRGPGPGSAAPCSACRAYGEPDLGRWERIVQSVKQPEGEVTIAVVGKYTNLLDAYKSLSEALTHGGIAHNVKVNLDWVDSQIFENDAEAVARLEKVHGILVPGGFGERGTEGKIEAVRFARETQDPVLRHLLRHADGGDRGGAEPAATSRAPPAPNSAPAPSRWSGC